MSGDASDSSEDSDTQTNEKACTVKHQITNGKSVILQATHTSMCDMQHSTDATKWQKLNFPFGHSQASPNLSADDSPLFTHN